MPHKKKTQADDPIKIVRILKEGHQEVFAAYHAGHPLGLGGKDNKPAVLKDLRLAVEATPHTLEVLRSLSRHGPRGYEEIGRIVWNAIGQSIDKESVRPPRGHARKAHDNQWAIDRQAILVHKWATATKKNPTPAYQALDEVAEKLRRKAGRKPVDGLPKIYGIECRWPDPINYLGRMAWLVATVVYLANYGHKKLPRPGAYGLSSPLDNPKVFFDRICQKEKMAAYRQEDADPAARIAAGAAIADLALKILHETN